MTVRERLNRPVSRQQGFALVVVTVTLAILGAVVGDFGYNARVELESAANARDQLRAEYLARSGVNLSRLLIKVQSGVIDGVNKSFRLDIQIGDFAPFLMKAFGGTEDAGALGDLLGIDASSIKGLGTGKGATFDVEMKAEDGKINVNCGGGLNAGGGGVIPAAQPVTQPGSGPPRITNKQQALYGLLLALMHPKRYDRLFDNPDADGQYATRDEIARAIVDWSDIDEQRYDPFVPGGSGSGSEDYRYDGLRDGYKPHNNFYDTLEELQMVRGVGDDWWGSFSEMLTVYGSCKVNLNAIKPEQWPLMAAIIRVAAKNPQNPVLYDETMVAALAQQVGTIAQMLGGMQNPGDLNNFTTGQWAKNLPPGLAEQAGQGGALQPIPGMQAVDLDPNILSLVARTGPRQVYRIDSTGRVTRVGDKKIEVHIRAVFDAVQVNQNATGERPEARGKWVYWRMD